VRRYDSSRDRLFVCVIVYRTKDNRLTQVNIRNIAPAANEALVLAERHLSHDKRRAVAAIVHKEAIEQ